MRWTINLNIKAKIMKYLEYKTEHCICGLESGKHFLNKTQKVIIILKIDTLDKLKF